MRVKMIDSVIDESCVKVLEVISVSVFKKTKTEFVIHFPIVPYDSKERYIEMKSLFSGTERNREKIESDYRHIVTSLAINGYINLCFEEPSCPVNDIWSIRVVTKGEEHDTMVENSYGTKFYFDVVIPYMDNEIKEDVRRHYAPCSEQEFFDAYIKGHKEYYGEDWLFAEENPIY